MTVVISSWILFDQGGEVVYSNEILGGLYLVTNIKQGAQTIHTTNSCLLNAGLSAVRALTGGVATSQRG